MHEYRSPALKRFNCLLSETDAAYHEAALRQGLNDSSSRILYALCELGSPASLRAVCESTGLSKQIVNSALRKLEADGILYLEPTGARSKRVCLTEAGLRVADATAGRLIRLENSIFDEWPAEDVQQYLGLMERYLQAFRRKLPELGGAGMNSTFSGHFGYRRLLRVTLPSIVMMIFTSIYCVTDGFFVSNFAGKAAFTAVNFIMPYLMILGCVGFLFGTGGSALIGKTMGEGDRKHADRLFSMVICVTALSGLALGVLGIVLLRPVAELLGAEGELLENCVRYGSLILIANPAYVLQFAFQCLFATAGKPKLGLAVTVAAGVTNMVLDALFVGVFRWGIAGAAVATSLSQCVGGLLPLLYFLGKWNRSELHLTRFRFDGRALGRICGNGSSELMSNISMSLVGMLYNAQLMRYGGQNGIAAYGVLMYVSMIFHACFIGYAVGVSPVVSFHFGAQNRPELHSLLRKSLRLIGGSSIAMLAAGEALARPLGQIFVGYDEALLAMTVRAFRIYSFSFLLAGVAILGSSFFTALNDGLTSALISFLRTLVFQIAAVLLLPLVLELDGIWLSIVFAETMAVLVTTVFLLAKRKKYGY